jgi:hypothetical protein
MALKPQDMPTLKRTPPQGSKSTTVVPMSRPRVLQRVERTLPVQRTLQRSFISRELTPTAQINAVRSVPRQLTRSTAISKPLSKASSPSYDVTEDDLRSSSAASDTAATESDPTLQQLEGDKAGIASPFQRLSNGMVLVRSVSDPDMSQLPIEEYDLDNEAVPAQLIKDSSESDSDTENSTTRSDYPDSDDEIVRETDMIIESYEVRRPEINTKSVVNMDFATNNTQLQNEVLRISRILTKSGIDYSPEEVSVYAFHLTQKLVNDIEFPDSLSEILEDIMDTIGVKALGYD